MRNVLVIVLLLAAVAHPVIHVDDPLVCAAAHGAINDVAPPALAGLEVNRTPLQIPAPGYASLSVAGRRPARAPPAA